MPCPLAKLAEGRPTGAVARIAPAARMTDGRSMGPVLPGTGREGASAGLGRLTDGRGWRKGVWRASRCALSGGDAILRKACLKTEHTSLYPERCQRTSGSGQQVWRLEWPLAFVASVTPDQWPAGRVLPDEHFEFTGGRRRRRPWRGPGSRLGKGQPRDVDMQCGVPRVGPARFERETSCSGGARSWRWPAPACVSP